jgi:predicted hydrolase (HD superfamily)
VKFQWKAPESSKKRERKPEQSGKNPIIPKARAQLTNQIPAPPPARDAAWALLTEFTQSPSLLKHALAVESCVRAYGEQEAARRGLVGNDIAQFVEIYSATGLLHDFDYERYPSPQEHPYVGVRVLEERGWPAEIRHAILGHAEYTGTPRISHLDKTLFACDELAGFLTACALIKPSKSIHDVEVAGVRKKLKDKAFARGVNRDDVIHGATELGIDLDQHIVFCLSAMQRDAEALGLAGPPNR